MSVNDNVWTPGEERELQRLTLAKAKRADIALALQRTSGSVVSKQHRMSHTPLRRQPLNGTQQIAQARANQFNKDRRLEGRAGGNFNADPGLSDVARPASDSRPVALLDLTDAMCKFPINGGVGAITFCGTGASAEPRHRPYCEFHARLAYTSL